jgi:hypothetical protein
MQCECSNFEPSGNVINFDAMQCKNCLGYMSGLRFHSLNAESASKKHDALVDSLVEKDYEEKNATL